jgi:hypothetical protein
MTDDKRLAMLGMYTVESATDGYPLGELTCVSHTSLSPIGPLTEDR